MRPFGDSFVYGSTTMFPDKKNIQLVKPVAGIELCLKKVIIDSEWLKRLLKVTEATNSVVEANVA